MAPAGRRRRSVRAPSLRPLAPHADLPALHSPVLPTPRQVLPPRLRRYRPVCFGPTRPAAAAAPSLLRTNESPHPAHVPEPRDGCSPSRCYFRIPSRAATVAARAAGSVIVVGEGTTSSPSRIRCAIWSSAVAIACAGVGGVFRRG